MNIWNKIKNPIEKEFKDDLAYLLSLKSYSGIYHLDFNGNKFKYINIGNDDFGILKFFGEGNRNTYQ